MNHLQLGELAAPTVVDVEASGFGRASYPIEVGVVLPDGHSFCSLIQPEPDWTHWDPQAEKVHHISRDLLLRKGRPALAVARHLNTLLRGQTVYTDGWANDYSWLARLFDVADLQPAFKLENLRLLLLEHQVEHWHEVKNEVASERGPQRHRASADARVLQLTLQRIRNRFGPDATGCPKTGGAAANP